MDPVTQGVIGASLSQSFSEKKTLAMATLAGTLGGMAADLDIFILSKKDPLLALEFHRQFTHSLIFIPLGGFIVSIFVWWVLLRKRVELKKVYLYSTFGYATHGLLDACTSYGTLLYWPFSNTRVAWDNISIIDPIFTLSLLFGVVLSLITKNKIWSRAALVFSMLYLTFGFYQKEQAKNKITQVAAVRKHNFTRLEVKPSLGNLFLWRTMYEYNNSYYVDAVRVSPAGSGKFFEGRSVKKLNVEKDFPNLVQNSIQRKDIERFRWFSRDWLYISSHDPFVIGDLRYSRLPNSIQPLFGIRINPTTPQKHVEYGSFLDRKNFKLSDFFSMLFD